MEIDRDILEVEQRIAGRRLRVESLARASGRRIVPMGLLGGAALGFLAVAAVMRRPQYEPARRGGKRGLLGSLAGVAATVGLQLLRAQLGSPAQMTQKALAFFRRKSPAGDIRQAQHNVRFGG